MMKNDRRRWWILFLLIASGIAILAGYYMGMDKGSEKEEILVSEKSVPQKLGEEPQKVVEPSQVKKEISPERVVVPIEEPRPVAPEDPCRLIEDQLLEFFDYLDKKSYVKTSQGERNTYDRFKKLLRTLSSHPPVPAGEGLSLDVMTRNIFHFFRILGKEEIRLTRDVIRNEADTLEMNMELFYNWLMLGPDCPDHKKIRPSRDILYHYAGFFINSIGGRSYLFRRPSEIRLLVSYYSILIIHETDRFGKNHYGIDISPEIASLKKEIGASPDLRFQGDYLRRLTELQEYYGKKR